MLEGYVIAEVSSILQNAFTEMTGQRIDQEAKENLTQLARFSLPKLDNYFNHRLKVEELKKQIEEANYLRDKVEQDKGFNDAAYLELSAEMNGLREEVKLYKSLLKIIVNKGIN